MAADEWARIAVREMVRKCVRSLIAELNREAEIRRRQAELLRRTL